MLCGLLLTTLLCCPQNAPAPYSCGPFLLQPGTDTMTIVVDHESEVPAILEWGPVGQDRMQIEHAKARRHHIFELAGLDPDQEHSYRVRTANRLSSGERSFRTLPLAPESYRVVALGDVRSRPAMWGRVSRRVLENERDALFMIGTGDYPADGRLYSLWVLQFFRPAQDLLARMPIWPAIGNHEATRPASSFERGNSKYFSLFELPGNEHWYRVDYHLMTLLVLDSNSHCDPGSAQYKWLRAELRSKRARFTLVAFHHAPFTSGPHGGRLLDGTPREWPLDETRRFLIPLFEMYFVDLVLNGHDHLYERSEKDGIVYIVTGGGGAPLYKVDTTDNPYQKAARSTHHYVTLDVDAAKIVARAVDMEGRAFDEVTIAANETWLKRRRGFLAKELESGVHLGSLDDATLSLAFSVSNPLDHRLEVWLDMPDKVPEKGAEKGTDPPLVLAPGARHEGTIDLSWARPELAAEPWTADVIVPLEVLLEGRDQAMAMRVPVRRDVVLRRKHYPVSLATPRALDGDLAEWGNVRAMAVGDTADCGATVRVTRTATHIFVAAEITDDDVRARDGIHFLFAPAADVEERKTTGSIVSHSAWSDGRLVSSDKTTKSSLAVQGRILERTGGYTVEMSIPLGRIPVDAKGHVGFDILINDHDDGAADSVLRLWSTHQRTTDPSQFGFLHLAE